jgi:hypothetical protein
METAAHPPGFISFVPLMFICFVTAALSYQLAKEKGRNVGLWAVLGLVPLVNFCCMFYFAGASNLNLEAKLNEILRQMASRETGQASSV